MSPVAQRALAIAAVAGLAIALAVVVLARRGDDATTHRSAGALGYAPGRERELADAAARGNAHVLYAKLPGGARASAARTARFRPQVEQAAATAGVDADDLEGLVLLESAGRDDAVAASASASGALLQGAVGLTQILAETGRNLLGIRVDPAGARRVGRSLRRAERRGDDALAARLRARRMRVDERFDPAKSLAATARYLLIAKRELRRDDLALESYHMGIGNLQDVLRAYGDDDVSYAKLYFDSTPLRHAAAWRRLAALGDDSSTYLWRVAAAREIMRLYRSGASELDRISELQNAKNSAEEVLHPGDETERYATPDELRATYDAGDVVATAPALLAKHGLVIDPGMGALASRLGAEPALYRGLRKPALALLAYLGEGVRKISGSGPLVVTSSVRDERYQRLLVARNREATAGYSLHTTGWAFDILRSYSTRAQALAFEFMLDRLQSLDLIAWVREPAAIHVTVSQDARDMVGLPDGG